MAERFHDWRFAFFIPAAALFGIWVIFVIFQRNRPEDMGLCSIEEYHGESAPETSGAKEEEREGSWDAIIAALKNPMVLRLALVYFFLKPTRYAILFWGPVIVSEKLGTGMAKSGLISALFELAGPIGVIFAGHMSDRVFHARRMPICVISLLALSLVTFSFDGLTGGESVWMMSGALFAIGFLLFGPDSLIVATAAVDFGTKKGASSAVGLINGFGSIGAVLGGSLPGIISQRYGWDVLFYILGAAVLISGLLLLPKWNAVPAHD
jgi:OPA family sugar phosphate sensor protein UhpC-like MFS transporter